MKCKNFIITVSAVLLMVCVSCSTSIDNVGGSSLRYSMLVQKVDSINNAYIGKVVATPIMYADSNNPNDDTSLKKKDDNSVFVADAVGFGTAMITTGAETVITGAGIGSFVFPGAGTLGGALAGTVDATIAGLAWGALASAVAAYDNNTDSTKNAGDVYWEKPDWIIYNEDVFFDEDIIGANIGWCHNDVIQGIWQDISSDEMLDAMDYNSLLDYITLYMEDRGLFTFEDRRAFNDALSVIWTNNYNYRDFIDPSYNQIIDGYFATITELDKEEWFSYTQSIMEEINGFGLPDADVLFLNGTISTFYYSSVLWNMDAVDNIPRED